MPGKETDSGRSSAVGSSSSKVAAEADVGFEWDSSRDSPQEWNGGESMRSGSGRSLASMGSKGDTNSVAESTASGGNSASIEVGKEVKEKKDKSSWVKTIGMRTLRLRKKDKDPEKSQSRISISSALGSLERPGKSKSKNKSEKQVKGDDDSISTASASGVATTNKPGEHVKDNDSIYSGASSKNGSVTREVLGGSVSVSASAAAGENADKQDPARFLGEGLLFKGKLIGVLEVSGPRGDRICQEALSELKMAVKAAGEHKQKITIHIALDGLRIRDEKTGDCLYHHQVHKISFIAQDLTDARAFGYIFGSPDTGHRFFGIKTEKSASQVVIAMRDLFQVVFDLKKKEIERAKQQLEMQQKFLATRAAETAPTTKTEPKFSIAETYIEGAGAVGGASMMSTGVHPSAPAEVDLLNLEVELNSLQEGLDNIHTNLADSVPFRGSTASISSDPMNPMPKLSTGSMASASNANNPTPVSNSAVVGDPFGDSFHPFDSGAAPSFHTSSRINMKHGLSDQPLPLGSTQQLPPYSNNTTPVTFTSDPFAQIDPFPGPKFHGEGDFFNSDPFDSPSGQFSFSFPNESASKLSIIGNSTEKIEENLNESRVYNEAPREAVSARSMGPREKHADGWVASFEDDFVPDSEANGQPDDQSKTELDIFTELDPLGTGRSRPFVDRKDFFQHLKNPPKKNLKDLGALENLTPHSSSSSLVAESNVAHASMTGLNVNVSTNNEITPPKVQFNTDISSIPNSFSTNFTSSQTGDMDVLPLKTPPTSASSRSSSIRLRLHSENSRSDSPPNYSPPPPPHAKHFSSTSSIGSAAGGVAATNSEYMSGSQLPFLPPPSSMLGTPPNSRFANKKSPQLLKQMTIAGSTATTATSSPKTLPRPSSGRERKLTADSQSSIGIDDIPNLTPPPRPPHSHTSNTLGKSVSLSTAVPRPSSGSDRLRNLSGMSSLSGSIAAAGIVPPEPPPRPLQTTTISSNFSQQLSPALVSPPPPLPPKKQTFSTVQSSPLNLFPSKPTPASDFSKSIQKISASESNDLPLPLPSRKPHFSSTNQSVGGRYSVPLSSMSPSMQRRDDPDVKLTSSGSGNPPVIKLTMKQALHQVASLSLGDLASKLELPVEKLSSLTIQQLAEKLTLMDYEEKMEQKERELSKLSSSSNRDISSHNSRAAAVVSSGFQLGFEDDFSTASAPADLSDLKKEREEFDKYAVFRELSIEDASGFSITANIGSNKLSEFSANSEDEDLSRTMDKTLTNKDSSSERTIQADGTGETNHTNKDASFATAMANTMDDITDANLSDDDGKFPFDDDEDISPSSNFNTKPTEWATFESNFEDPFATTSLVKAADADGNGSPWDSEEEGGGNSQKTPPMPAPSENPADKFDFEPFQKPSQPTVTNYSLAEAGNTPQVPPVPERRRPSRENGGLQQSQPLSPDLLRSPVSQFHRQSSGSSKHSGKSIEEPSIGGKGSDYSESGRARHRRGSVGEEGRWERERERDRDTYSSRRRGDRENFGRSDSRDSYSSIPRGKSYRDGHGGESEEEYVPSKSSVRKGRNVVRPSSSKRSSDREGEPDDDKEVDEDTRSYASYHSNYSASGPRKHRRLPPKYHHHHYSSSQRRRERDRERPPGTQGPGSGHSSISPERYSHHESDFDDSYEEENGGSRKKDLYAREREYAERHYLRSRPSSGGGYHSSKRYSRDSPRHSDPYYRDRDRYYRPSERPRRTEYEDGNGREFSECSGDEDRYHGRHGHRRRHRGRDEYYRDREREPRHHHYYTNSPSWDSDSGPEAAGERSEKGHRPSSGKYGGSEHGNSSRHSPPPGSSSSRPNSGRRESGTQKPHSDHSVSGNGHSSSNHATKKQSGSSKMREYRFDERFSGEAFAAKLEQLDRDYSNDAATRKGEDADSLSEPLSNAKRQSPVVKSETITPVDHKLSQPQSPFEDNFVIPPNNTNGTDGDEKTSEDLQEVGDANDVTSPENEVEGNSSKKSRQKQIFFPTKFESEDGEGDDENLKNVASNSKLEEDNQEVGNNHEDEDRGETPSPDLSFTPPTSTTSLRGNFSVYSTKRLESIRSEEEKSNEDSVSESALTNNASNMKKSDSFNIFQAPTQDPFADDDFFT